MVTTNVNHLKGSLQLRPLTKPGSHSRDQINPCNPRCNLFLVTSELHEQGVGLIRSDPGFDNTLSLFIYLFVFLFQTE